MLKQRVLTALVLGLILALVLFAGGILAWKQFLLLAAMLAADEWVSLGYRSRPIRFVYTVFTSFAAAELLFLPGVDAGVLHTILVAGVTFWCLLVPPWLWFGWRLASGLRFLLTGWLVILPTIAALLVLRKSGVALLLACMAIVWVSDIAAYFSGRRFGRHRLAPAISPGKTWEGVAGALVLVLAVGTALVLVPDLIPALSAALRRAGWRVLPLLAVLVMLGIEGDLFESWLKRCVGVKDSGWILPGHGGVLDRIDALTAALPLAALIIAQA